jgi:hypothetical protein
MSSRIQDNLFPINSNSNRNKKWASNHNLPNMKPDYKTDEYK